MAQSSIEWTEKTWNPVTGCTKISQGCKFCYAEKFARRLQLMGAENYRNGFTVTTHPGMLDRPLRWKRPSVIFVNSIANIKFLSLEPLLGGLPGLNLADVDWVIVGGESGAKARPMRQEWVEDIQRQCEKSGVPFFFKQWGGKNKKRAGRMLNGRTWDEMPAYIVR